METTTPEKPAIDLYPSYDSQGRQIIYIDASALKDFACRRKFYWNTIVGWKAKTNWGADYRMEYGTAFHKFLEDYYSNKPVTNAIDRALKHYEPVNKCVPADDYRDLFHLEMSVTNYVKTQPREHDNLKANKGFTGEYLTEQKFSIPYKIINDKYVIVLCGTIDLIGMYNGIPCIADHKTTSGNPRNYFDEYELGIQPMFYCYIDKLVNKRNDVLPFLINGIFLKKQTDKVITKGGWDGALVQRSNLMFFSKDQMSMFEEWLGSCIAQIVTSLQATSSFSMENDPELSACKTPYGLCKYFKVCKMGDNVEHRNMILNSFYERKHYNPLLFGKES